MKKTLTLSFVLIASVVLSQAPVIEGTYLPVRGTKIKQVYETNNPSMAAPSPGTNMTWNYGSSFTNTLDTFELATYDPSDPLCNCSQYLPYFPGATHISFLRAPFLFDDSTFSFFRVDTMGVWSVGAMPTNNFIKSVGLDTAFISVDDDLFTPASPSFGGTLTDSSRYLMYPGSSSVIVRRGIKKLEGIGYGTLTTPAGTFNNVLLAKETNFRWDTLGTLGNQVYSFTRYIFLRNNTFGSSVLLLHQMSDTSSSATTAYAWYTLPVDFGSISGAVRDSSGTLVTACPNCEAYLYRENSNFSKHDILAKSPIDGSGNYQFDSIPYGIYRVAIRPDTILYRNSLTTYYGDTTYWIDADTINTLACQCNTTGRDINLQYRPGHSNTVTLSGHLTLDWGVSKNGRSTPFIPSPTPFAQIIPGVDVVIRKTPGGNAMVQSQTTGSGSFSFTALDNDTYEMFVDIPGLFMANTYTFTISGSTVNNTLDFVVGRDSIHPATTFVGISNAETVKSSGIKVYPNPVSSDITIEFAASGNEGAAIEIYNAIGVKCLYVNGGATTTGINKFSLNTSSLPAGLYFVRALQGSEVFQTTSFIKN